MTLPEKQTDNSGEGPLTAPELFRALCKALSSKGKYLGDGHYLFGVVDIVPEISGGTQAVPGKFRLEDYGASDTKDWRFGDNGGADPVQQAHLLESGNTVLTVQLYPDGSKSPFGTWYSGFRPSDVREGDDFSVTGEIMTGLGISHDGEEPLFVREGFNVPPRVAEPQSEPQLQLLYRAITAIAQ